MLTRENQLTTKKKQTKAIDPPFQTPILKELNKSLYTYGIGCIKDGKVIPVEDEDKR